MADQRILDGTTPESSQLVERYIRTNFPKLENNWADIYDMMTSKVDQSWIQKKNALSKDNKDLDLAFNKIYTLRKKQAEGTLDQDPEWAAIQKPKGKEAEPSTEPGKPATEPNRQVSTAPPPTGWDMLKKGFKLSTARVNQLTANVLNLAADAIEAQGRGEQYKVEQFKKLGVPGLSDDSVKKTETAYRSVADKVRSMAESRSKAAKGTVSQVEAEFKDKPETFVGALSEAAGGAPLDIARQMPMTRLLGPFGMPITEYLSNIDKGQEEALKAALGGAFMAGGSTGGKKIAGSLLQQISKVAPGLAKNLEKYGAQVLSEGLGGASASALWRGFTGGDIKAEEFLRETLLNMILPKAERVTGKLVSKAKAKIAPGERQPQVTPIEEEQAAIAKAEEEPPVTSEEAPPATAPPPVTSPPSAPAAPAQAAKAEGVLPKAKDNTVVDPLTQKNIKLGPKESAVFVEDTTYIFKPTGVEGKYEVFKASLEGGDRRERIGTYRDVSDLAEQAAKIRESELSVGKEPQPLATPRIVEESTFGEGAVGAASPKAERTQYGVGKPPDTSYLGQERRLLSGEMPREVEGAGVSEAQSLGITSKPVSYEERSRRLASQTSATSPASTTPRPPITPPSGQPLTPPLAQPAPAVTPSPVVLAAPEAVVPAPEAPTVQAPARTPQAIPRIPPAAVAEETTSETQPVETVATETVVEQQPVATTPLEKAKAAAAAAAKAKAEAAAAAPAEPAPAEPAVEVVPPSEAIKSAIKKGKKPPVRVTPQVKKEEEEAAKAAPTAPLAAKGKAEEKPAAAKQQPVAGGVYEYEFKPGVPLRFDRLSDAAMAASTGDRRKIERSHFKKLSLIFFDGKPVVSNPDLAFNLVKEYRKHLATLPGGKAPTIEEFAKNNWSSKGKASIASSGEAAKQTTPTKKATPQQEKAINKQIEDADKQIASIKREIDDTHIQRSKSLNPKRLTEALTALRIRLREAVGKKELLQWRKDRKFYGDVSELTSAEAPKTNLQLLRDLRSDAESASKVANTAQKDFEAIQSRVENLRSELERAESIATEPRTVPGSFEAQVKGQIDKYNQDIQAVERELSARKAELESNIEKMNASESREEIKALDAQNRNLQLGINTRNRRLAQLRDSITAEENRLTQGPILSEYGPEVNRLRKELSSLAGEEGADPAVAAQSELFRAKQRADAAKIEMESSAKELEDFLNTKKGKDALRDEEVYNKASKEEKAKIEEAERRATRPIPRFEYVPKMTGAFREGVTSALPEDYVPIERRMVPTKQNLSKIDAEIQDLSSRLKQADGKVAVRRKYEQFLEENISRRKQQVEEQQRIVDFLQEKTPSPQKIESARNDIRKNNETIKSLRDKVKETSDSSDIAELEKTIKTLQAENSRLNQILNKTPVVPVSVEESAVLERHRNNPAKALEKELLILESKKRELQRTENSLKEYRDKQLNEATLEADDIFYKIENLEAEYAQMENRIAGVIGESDKAKVRSSIKSGRGSLDDLKKQIDMLREKFAGPKAVESKPVKPKKKEEVTPEKPKPEEVKPVDEPAPVEDTSLIDAANQDAIYEKAVSAVNEKGSASRRSLQSALKEFGLSNKEVDSLIDRMKNEGVVDESGVVPTAKPAAKKATTKKAKPEPKPEPKPKVEPKPEQPQKKTAKESESVKVKIESVPGGKFKVYLTDTAGEKIGTAWTYTSKEAATRKGNSMMAEYLQPGKTEPAKPTPTEKPKASAKPKAEKPKATEEPSVAQATGDFARSSDSEMYQTWAKSKLNFRIMPSESRTKAIAELTKLDKDLSNATALNKVMDYLKTAEQEVGAGRKVPSLTDWYKSNK